jgi:hypothetical protein
VRSRLRVALICVLALYLLGLVWGYVRLPWAAIRSLRDYHLVVEAPAVTFAATLEVSPAQRWYLEHCLTESPVPTVPRIDVEVPWNALVLARVRSGYFVSGTGAEQRDSLYVCVFGAWVPVYNFFQAIS